ncbi:MAG: hypothetical protein M1537_06930 [Nitrospirae bacterium]|nr:MAG: hypothetical protein D084_Lepto4C00252G0001 [Leptospirillum sp. Group IV 'UBA BS']MCL4486043.1 hypothetical protein [Nitrospirota bacterium]
MSQPPLRLELHYYDEVHTRFNPAVKSSETPTPFGIGVWSSVLENREDPLKFMLRMRIVVPHPSKESIPIQGSFGIVGVFSVDQSISKEQRASLVKVTGGAMLYSAAREFILLVTYRTSPFPPFYLPTLSGKALAEAPDLETISGEKDAPKKSLRSEKPQKAAKKKERI